MIPGVVGASRMVSNATAAGPPSSPYAVTVTVPSGTVASDLTDFPFHVRLSEMPTEFWDHVKSDGGDIRVWFDDALVPMDLSRFDYESQDGVLWIKGDLATASDTEFEIRYGNADLTLLDYTDTNGRNAVWSDYESVFLLGETTHNRTGGVSATVSGDPGCFEHLANSPDVNSHNGVCWDGTYYYTTDNATLTKWDASWSAVDTNSNVLTDSGIVGAFHMGGIDIYQGAIYCSTVGSATSWITRWDATDLSFIDKFEVTAQDTTLEGAGCCIRLDTERVVFASFGNSTSMWEYELDGTFVGTITLNIAIAHIQDVAWWHGAFWVPTSSGDETHRVETDGSVWGGMFGSHSATTWEGVSPGPDDTLIQVDDTGGAELVRTYKPYDIPLGAGGGANFWGDNQRIYGQLSSVGVVGTVFSMGVSAVPDTTATRNILSCTAAGLTTSQTVVISHGNAAPYYVWDSTNAHLYAAISPVANVPRRLNATYNGTTARSLFVDGANKVTDSTITARGTGFDYLVMGNGIQGGNSAVFRGEVGFCYVRAGILSDNWIAAEYANLDDPAAFAVCGAEVEL